MDRSSKKIYTINTMKSFFSNKPNPIEQTIIIIGAARSGTSIPASILHHAGVYLGEYTNGYQYEDKYLELNFKEWQKDNKSQLDEFRKTIDERNKKYKVWGWKDINVVWYLKDILGRLRNPTFIITSRNPLHIAYSSFEKDKKHHEVNKNYRFETFKSAVHQVSKQMPYINPNIPVAVLDFEEMQNKIVTKPLLDWLGVDYNESIQEAISDTYYHKK